MRFCGHIEGLNKSKSEFYKIAKKNGNTVFRHIVSALKKFPQIYVLWPLDFQIQKRIVSDEEIRYT